MKGYQFKYNFFFIYDSGELLYGAGVVGYDDGYGDWTIGLVVGLDYDTG